MYVTDSADLAEIYANNKRGAGGSRVMPLFTAVRNPYVADVGLKKRLRYADAEQVQAFTKALQARGFDGVVLPLDDDAVELVAFAPAQIKSAIGNNGEFDAGNPDIRYSISAKTRAAYEARIDALFAGEKARLQGVRVLDRSDMLGLLGHADKPVLLAEGKVLAGRQNHPRMTAAVWKKVPEWMENPAAVFESDTDGGLVLIAPETLGGAPVSIIVRPDTGKPNTLNAHLLLNAYDRSSTTPFMRWINDGLLQYVDTKKFPALVEATSGRRLPGTALQNKPGTRKILTEKNLAGWRKANAAPTESGLKPDSAQVASVQQQAERITAQWKNAPEVVVVSDMQDKRVPPDVQNRSRDQSGAVEGFFHDGKVYLVADRLGAPQDVARVLMHEALGHYGLRGVFGERLDRVLKDIASIRWRETVAKAQAYGMLPEGMAQDATPMDKWRALTLDQRLEAAEEVLAEMAQSQPQLGFVRRAAAAVRSWLRRHVPGFDRWRVSNDELIRNYILPARGWVTRGKQMREQGATQIEPRFSRGRPTMSDEDKARILRGESVASVRLEDAPSGGYGEVVRWAAGLFKQKGGKAISPDIGEVLLNEQAARDSMAHGGANAAKKAAFGAVKDVIERGALVYQATHGETDSFYISAPVSISGRDNIVTALVRRDVNTQRMYLHSVMLKENLLKPSVSAAGAKAPKPHSATTSGDAQSISPNAQGRKADSAEVAAELRRLLTLDVQGAVGGNGPRFSRLNAAGVQERAQAVIDTPAQGAARPLDAVTKAVTRGLGVEKVTQATGDAAARWLRRLTPDVVKAGLVADYGLPESVIDRRVLMQGRKLMQLRKTGTLLDKLHAMTQRESEIAYEWMTSKEPDAVMRGLANLPQEQIEVLQEVQQMIDDLSREAVELGLLSQSAYDRHKGTYLHRSYLKHVLASQEKKPGRGKGGGTAVLGANLHRRGIDAVASMGQVRQAAPEWWGVARRQGKADPDLIGRKLIRMERRAASGEGTATFDGMPEKRPGRLLEVRYLPADQPLPREYADWTNAGQWEVRNVSGENLNLWRDYTAQERQRMGEIRDVRHAVLTTMQGMIADVETARYFRWLAQNHAQPEGAEVEGSVVEASEGYWRPFRPDEWVHVPDSVVPGTHAKRYGALAGKYVPGPVWNDIRHTMRRGQIMEGQAGEWWDAALRLWKTSKTALSPAVHTNNIMSNFVMADWADVSMGHIAKALTIVMGSHAMQGRGVIGRSGNVAARALGMADRDVAREILNRYKESGGEMGSWVVTETMQNQLEPMLERLQANLAQDDTNLGAQVGVAAALQHLMHGQFRAAGYAAKGSWVAKKTGQELKNMIELYGNEDSVFRLAAWLKAKEDGATDLEAGKFSRKAFLDYNINAPWIQLAKSTGWPFISFSYRGLPLLAETLAKKPHKLLKLMAVAGALSQFGLMLAGGEDDEDVRRLLPDEKAGGLWGVVPKLIRMPWNDAHSSPVYLDVRRWVPMGDVFDVGQGHAALPLPPAIMPTGPLVSMGEIVLNKSSFTGKPITLETDTFAEKAAKVMDHAYKAAAPNLLGLPGTYATTNVSNAVAGKTDVFGREQSKAMAVASGFGLKLGAYPADVLVRNAELRARAQIAEIERGIQAAQRQHGLNGMTDQELEKLIDRQTKKRNAVVERLMEKLHGE